MKYCFGPVPSRRLGLSLGVDILPVKTCNLNCIYCELGASSEMTGLRMEYVPTEAVKEEIAGVVEQDIDFDAMTFSASGETTLHSRLGELILFAGKHTRKPIVVITNGTTMADAAVREELCGADIVMPSLDSAIPSTFRKINRPLSETDPAKIIQGIQKFRKRFHGLLWLEILLVKGINDNRKDIDALVNAVDIIQPDRVQLNTVNRPPAESWVQPLSEEKMKDICGRFGKNGEIIANFHNKSEKSRHFLLEHEIMETLRRRPLSLNDIEEMLGADARHLKKVLNSMEHKGIVEKVKTGAREFFKPLTTTPISRLQERKTVKCSRPDCHDEIKEKIIKHGA